MKSKITIHDEHGYELAFDALTFPGGEPHVNFGDDEMAQGRKLWVDARIGDADGWMTLLATLDAVRAMKPSWLGLFLPYFPGARQDRRQGGAFTAKIYADGLKSAGDTYGGLRPCLEKIVVLDPHSTVLQALLTFEAMPLNLAIPLEEYDGIICPDAGATQRTEEIADWLTLDKVYYGRKHRDPDTGKLSGFSCDPLPKGRFLVVDDICDGGGTFVGLAEAITKQQSACTLDLYVSHGIFSKGTEKLLTLYEDIYTTDSWPADLPEHDRLHVKPLHDIARKLMMGE